MPDSDAGSIASRSDRADIRETRKALADLTDNYNTLRHEFLHLHNKYTTLKNAKMAFADLVSPQSPEPEIQDLGDFEDENNTTLVENAEFITVSKKSTPAKKPTSAKQWPPLNTNVRNLYKTRTQEFKQTPAGLSTASGSGIATSNRFDALAGEDNTVSKQPGTTPPVKATKPPPLIVPGMTSMSARAFMIDVGIKSDFETKNTHEGVKVFVKNKDEYLTITQHLKDKQVNYYSHPFNEEKLSKFVLSGLCRTNYTDIASELNSAGFFPVKITEINLENKRWEDDGTFIVYFNKLNPATLAQLLEVKTLCYTRVTWKDFVHGNRKKHTQCRKCQRHGHGSSFCFMTPACMFCAEEHDTAACPDKNNAAKIKCALCKEKHTSNDPVCSFRGLYLENTNRARSARNPNPTVYPPPGKEHRFYPAPIPPPLEGTYAAASKGHIRKKTQATPPHQAPAGPGPLRQQRTIDLLTPDQVSVLLSNAIPRLMAARNGAEQITTILTICAEYVSQN